MATALAAFDLLDYYYREKFPAYYEDHQDKINLAISELKTSYQNSVFPEQKVSWSSHKDNIGHENSPGCLRCHDGQHLTRRSRPSVWNAIFATPSRSSQKRAIL